MSSIVGQVSPPWSHASAFQRTSTGESYTPAAKRIHGYFCPPVLWRDRFAGLVDSKAKRIPRRREVRGLHLEPGIAADRLFSEQLTQALQELAQFFGCDQLRQQHFIQ